MQIFNTLTRQKEEFVPQVPGEYRIYVCGPTVYNYIHIGNARPLIVFDTLRRYLEYRGNKVFYVSNITDIDDKLIKKGQEEGTSMKEVAQRFEAEYLKDAAGLNCKKPTVQPRATEHIQQILDIAARAGRKVAVCGRSMEKISRVATELGYLKDTGKVMIDISEIRRYARSQLIIVSTGSQGETMSALYRMAYGSHKQVEVNAGDRILIAASAIPGNEKSINNMVNELYKQGAEVIYDRSAAIHVSGHACQEDLKLMLGLCKPKYFIPVHGEYRMLVQHAGLAREMGVNPKNILITEIGRPVEISENSARLGNPVPSGRLLVDGLGIGDVGTAVLRDRKHLSEDGLLIVVVTVDATTGVVIAGPDIVSRGFVYVKEAEALMEELRTISQMALDRCSVENLRDWNSLKTAIKGDVSDYLFKKTKRSPMVLPIIQEI